MKNRKEIIDEIERLELEKIGNSDIETLFYKIIIDKLYWVLEE